MKLYLILLLAVVASTIAGPVPRMKKRRRSQQKQQSSDQARLFPIAIFNNGATTLAPGATPAADAEHTTAAAAEGGVTEEPALATRLFTTGDVETVAAADLPPAVELPVNLFDPVTGLLAIPTPPTIPNALQGLATLLNPFNLPAITNFFNTLPQPAAATADQNVLELLANAVPQPPAGTQLVNPLDVLAGNNIPNVFIWTPTTGAIPFRNDNRKRLLDEPEQQVDPNYVKLMQQLYYSSMQNPQRTSYLPSQYSTAARFPSPAGYPIPFPAINPYSHPRVPVYHPYAAQSQYSAYPTVNNPYYPMYLITVTPKAESNNDTQTETSDAGSETDVRDESQQGIVDQETAVHEETEVGESVAEKPETVKEKTQESEMEQTSNQESEPEQDTAQNIQEKEQDGQDGMNANPTDSKLNDQSQPTNTRGNSKFYVKFSRDPNNQRRDVYQRPPQSRSEVLPLADTHGPLVSSYRLRHQSPHQ